MTNYLATDSQMDLDQQAIRELHATWIDAVNAGDLVSLLAMMTVDVVFLNPGQAPLGRDGFSANFSAAQHQVRIRCISDLEEVVVVGDVAYTRSRDALSVTPRAGGE
ncbi:MAG: SgcJ/EcaC family oxidoreductase [Gemmatimonadaceae bacterium]